MFLLIDNYDSFTYNLVHYFGELGEELLVYRNDSIKAEEAVNLKIKGIIISPGPCDPDRAGICLNLIKHAANRKLPVFGVCLGHQVIGQAFGNKIIKAPRPMHGKLSKIEHVGKGVFRGIPNQFVATRYHSLMLDPNNMPDCLEVLAKTNDGVVQGIQHKSLPMYGVQFHPESIASEYGYQLLKNFISCVTERK